MARKNNDDKVIWVCDRCRRELIRNPWDFIDEFIPKLWVSLRMSERFEPNGGLKIKLDLCEPCSDALEAFLEGWPLMENEGARML